MVTALQIQNTVRVAIAPHAPHAPYLGAIAWAVGRASIPAVRLSRPQNKALQSAVSAAIANHQFTAA